MLVFCIITPGVVMLSCTEVIILPVVLLVEPALRVDWEHFGF